MNTTLLLSAVIASTTTAATLPLNLGNYSWNINNPLASNAFNLGIFHEFGFNQKEARKAMFTSTTLDPTCAMCHWGISYVNGPFLNHPIMDAQQLITTHAAILTALKLSKASSHAATNFEKDLIEATALRYPDANPARNQTTAFIAYANAMRQLYVKYPNNPNAAALFAESLMNLEANNYFKNETMGSDNKAIVPKGLRPFSKEASDVLLSVLSSTLRVFARHPFALHLYIHLTEAGVPGMKDGAMTGEQAADILRSLNYTGSGHLEHMPVRCLFVCWLLLVVVMCASCVVVVVVVVVVIFLLTLSLSLSLFF